MTALPQPLFVIPANTGILCGKRPTSPIKIPAFAGMTKVAAGIVALLALLLFAGIARAENFPAFTGLVVDAANVLPADRKAALEQKLQAFQQASTAAGQGRQFVVATVPSLEGDDIQDYGYQLGRLWGVGLKGADNGTILLVAPNERKVGIETGAGVQGVLTDAYTGVIIHGTILPAFKAGDMPGGIDKGVDAIIDIISQPDDLAKAKAQAAVTAYNKTHQSGDDGAALPVLLSFGIPIFIMFLLLRHRWRGAMGQRAAAHSNLPIWLWALESAVSSNDHDDHDGGGGFFGGGGGSSGGGGWGGGGFTGGGGGSFNGGGSSGGW